MPDIQVNVNILLHCDKLYIPKNICRSFKRNELMAVFFVVKD